MFYELYVLIFISILNQFGNKLEKFGYAFLKPADNKSIYGKRHG